MGILSDWEGFILTCGHFPGEHPPVEQQVPHASFAIQS